MPSSCPFCPPLEDSLAFEGDIIAGIWDKYPVNPGHLLLVPKAHVETWFEASTQNQRALLDAIPRAKKVIEDEHDPDGYNIGVNVSEAAGQTVPHLHVHVIPRYEGDVDDPRGGVRHVIPSKGNYLGD